MINKRKVIPTFENFNRINNNLESLESELDLEFVYDIMIYLNKWE
jgi:hypothetical protein